MSSKKNIPRNSFVQAMNARNKTQVFHHKTEERGGARNTERELLEDLDADCIVTFEETKAELEQIETELGIQLNIENNIRETLYELDRQNKLQETELVARWHQLYAVYHDWLDYEK